MPNPMSTSVNAAIDVIKEALAHIDRDALLHFSWTSRAEGVLAALQARGEPVAQTRYSCGCVTCICEDEVQCHGCGATKCKSMHCERHPLADQPAQGEGEPVADDLRYRIAAAICIADGRNPDEVIWQGSPPEPFGALSGEYLEHADAAIKAFTFPPAQAATPIAWEITNTQTGDAWVDTLDDPEKYKRNYPEMTLAPLVRPAQAARPKGWRNKIERAIERAKVFDDGSDGADAESTRSVVGILTELLSESAQAARVPDDFIRILKDLVQTHQWYWSDDDASYGKKVKMSIMELFVDHENDCDRDPMAILNAAPAPAEKVDSYIAQTIHYPQCWDTAAYPTLAHALWEMLPDNGRCTTCDGGDK